MSVAVIAYDVLAYNKQLICVTLMISPTQAQESPIMCILNSYYLRINRINNIIKFLLMNSY